MFFKKKQKSILFFPINGSGLGHLNRCLAYARHMPKSWKILFFSLSAAVEPVEEMGFEVDYFLSHFWTQNNSTNWNRELAIRLGLILEHARPDILLFDGTWPYLGLRRALKAYKRPLKLVWSKRGLWKTENDRNDCDIFFDLLIQPGEMGKLNETGHPASSSPPLISTAPVTLFDREELLPPEEARKALNLAADKEYILFSTGSGNLKDMGSASQRLAEGLKKAGYCPVWLQSPIAVHATPMPDNVLILRKYPISLYLKAFSGLVAAAGYNSCHEAAMAGLPCLFLPNEKLLDNQKKRALFLTECGLAILCTGDDSPSLDLALDAYLGLLKESGRKPLLFPNGASAAARALLELAEQ